MTLDAIIARGFGLYPTDMLSRKHLRRAFPVVAAFCFLTAWAEAQTGLPLRPNNAPSVESAPGSIRGRVVLPDGAPVSEAFRITLSVLRGTQAVAYTDQQGQFEFRGLTPGEYAIEVEVGDRRRFDVTRETIQVFRGTPSNVTLALKEKTESTSVKGAPSVSVAEIAQNIPSKARGEFDRGSKAAKEGKKAEAIAHLRKAIEIYPDFLMARNDLGALLLESGSLDEAEQELRRAVEVDPKAFNPKVNLGIVLVKKHEFAEAVLILDQGTALNPGSPLARLYLGMALIAVENLDRAESELKTAYEFGGREYALALFSLGQLYMQKGQRGAALRSFELYLRDAPNAENSNEARKLISMLQ
jgi:Flp pilus assembly protein TadD